MVAPFDVIPPGPLPRDFAVAEGRAKGRIVMGTLLMVILGGILLQLAYVRSTLGLGANAQASSTLLAVVIAFLALLTAYFGAITFMAVPRMRFHVGAKRFEVRTLFGKTHWPTAGLRAQKHIAHFDLRLFGVSITGYSTGWFLVDGKKTLVFSTGGRAGILIEGPTRVFVTPADPDGMLQSLRLAGVRVD